jgi:hypothetical protein
MGSRETASSIDQTPPREEWEVCVRSLAHAVEEIASVLRGLANTLPEVCEARFPPMDEHGLEMLRYKLDAAAAEVDGHVAYVRGGLRLLSGGEES